MFSGKLTNYLPKWLLETAIIFFVAIIVLLTIIWLFEKKYQDKIYPGVWLGQYNLGGLTANQAKQLINNQTDKINQQGINFSYQNSETIIYPVVASFAGDLAYYIIGFDNDQAVNQAISFARGHNIFINLENKIKALILRKKIFPLITLNELKIAKNLRDKFSQFEQPAQDATLIIDQTSISSALQSQITQEKLGKIIDYQKGINELKFNLSQLTNKSIKLTTKTDYPKIYKADCLNIEAKIAAALNLAPLTLTYEKQSWTINKNLLADWLALKNNSTTTNSDKIIIGLNQTKLEEYLNKEVAVKINQEPIDAKFQFMNGRVTEFQASQDGIELNITATINKIEEQIINNQTGEITLVVQLSKSAIHTENINEFGIKEIIGIGESNFAGSPANRRHNIKTGANTLSGLLIKPNEEFSLNQALGKIDKSTGYLPELVIKENKTIPEYGGGLCQIGTTMFRGALASGLPITMRRNHSYRVVYYEPAGTDAAIYNPWPDLKFINDTNNYILIQSRIAGDKLFFDFWGAKDGRLVEQTKSTIYNIVKPGPTKLIETLDLPIGETKCTEHAHNGADTYFDYQVTYPPGEIYSVRNSCPENPKKIIPDCKPTTVSQTAAWDKISNGVKTKKFSSHYVPWQEVCLIGVEKLSTENNNATTTPISPTE